MMPWVRLTLTFGILQQRLERELRRQGLSIPQLELLVCLYRSGGLPLSRVAERLLVTGGNVTGVVDRLEREGYVYRQRDERDRRRVYARLTPQGERVCREVIPAYERAVERLMSALTPEERRQLTHLLRKLSREARG